MCAWIVVAPLYVTIFLPGNFVWHALKHGMMLGSGSSITNSGLVVTTLLVNSIIGLGIGFLIQGIRHLKQKHNQPLQ
jgi:hypothetical protein